MREREKGTRELNYRKESTSARLREGIKRKREGKEKERKDKGPIKRDGHEEEVRHGEEKRPPQELSPPPLSQSS